MNEDENRNPYESLPASNQNLTFRETSRLIPEGGAEWDEQQMVRLGLVSDGLFTNLAYFLSDQFSQNIRMAASEDKNKVSFGKKPKLPARSCGN